MFQRSDSNSSVFTVPFRVYQDHSMNKVMGHFGTGLSPFYVKEDWPPMISFFRKRGYESVVSLRCKMTPVIYLMGQYYSYNGPNSAIKCH